MSSIRRPRRLPATAGGRGLFMGWLLPGNNRSHHGRRCSPVRPFNPRPLCNPVQRRHPTKYSREAGSFIRPATSDSVLLTMGIYSAVLGFFIPSGGGKWLLEAPYVMQAANELKVHLGWAVQVYNAAEALPNLINPFWMLPLLGVLGIRARDVVGFTFLQLLVHLPVVLFLLWLMARTLPYVPPVMPA